MPEDERKLKFMLKEFFTKNLAEIAKAEDVFRLDFGLLHRFSPELAEFLIEKPEEWFSLADECLGELDLPGPRRPGIVNLEVMNIRDLRSKHIGKFVCVEGIIRKSSEIRPEIMLAEWRCPDCDCVMQTERVANHLPKPGRCESCGNRKGIRQVSKKLVDCRWAVIEEPFELTEGERPSQLTLWLKGDLVKPGLRSLTDPGNRIRVTGILREIPKGRSNVKLDFYLDVNYFEPTEIGYERVEITPEDEERIKELAKDPKIYDMLVDSLAPSLYGMREIKEAIVLQLFGGVPRTLPDGTKFRGNIHILLIGDPASGKSQLMKLVPNIVPRGKYVSGKGVTTAGLTATVTRDEQFMGGWVVEAGAMVLANKGLLSVDEFEKMSADDQVAMHEALEQGTVSIAKASIVTTLPAQTSVLAGGNPKFGRFDPYMPIAKQITIPDTLLGRFDLKFVLKDIPNPEEDAKVVDHIFKSRFESEETKPALEPSFIRKYIAYAREHCNPEHTEETKALLKNFYVNTRKKAQSLGAPIPITLRQFEALLRLSEASARIQLQDKVRKEDALRAIRLMRYSLRQLGYDPETGQIDIDRTEGLTTSTERSAIRVILDLVNVLGKKRKEIPVDELLDAAEKEGISRDRAEDIIEKLKRDGLLFEPSPKFLQKV
ncbi:MAG: AAA family ATPase [Candidatus Aenigmatarchaeota archaeon]|nr:MAG: AAA family ATPase [Candidatus Aenigmarchaeota archaeon]